VIIRLALAAAAILATIGAATAQYPQKPVKIVVPYAAGGGTDVQARYMAARLSERLGQQFVIENNGGAGGNIATAAAGKAEPDGYTLLFVAPAVAINVSLYARAGYDALADFVPVAGWAQSPLLFIKNVSLPVADLKGLAALAKANPGKLAFGSGQGFINHMVMELYKIETGTDILFVPYRGQAPAMTDLIGGQIQLTVDSIASAGPFVESGKVQAIATTSAARLPAFANVPTVAESGYPKLTGPTWYGVLAPAKTPPDIVAKLAAEIAAVQRDPAAVKRIAEIGGEPFVQGPAEFARFYRDEVAKWADVIAKSGMKKVE
jgi:tripartite-type tricarboxylate transporter receptor subunit TctC